MRKKVYVAAGYNTLYFGPGRKEFQPKEKMPGFETYLAEAANGVKEQVADFDVDEGFIGSFMSGLFLKQANLPAFLPMVLPELKGKPCTGIEGACGTGGRAVAAAVRSVLSELSDSVFVLGFEMQNVVKAVYGADILAGASYYHLDRKAGHSYFFPGVFSDRAGAYFNRYGVENTRRAFAAWYENAIRNARMNPKAQEYHNETKDLYRLALTPPDPDRFLPHLNPYDCSKVSDGASALLILSEEGLKKCGISKEDAVEIVSLGESEGDISEKPVEGSHFDQMANASEKAFEASRLSTEDIAVLEVHDCFSISAVLSLEAIGFAKEGGGPDFILEGKTRTDGSIPTNPSGGLIGFGHPTGASGIRQMVDLHHQLTGKAENSVKLKNEYGMMVSMGGNDKTVTAVIIKKD